MRDDPPDWPEPDLFYEGELNCDVCGCVLPRFHKDFLCGECAEDVRALKSTLEWKYPYYRED